MKYDRRIKEVLDRAAGRGRRAAKAPPARSGARGDPAPVFQPAYGGGVRALDQAFIYFSGRRHPAAQGEAEVTGFLNHLAAEREVAASTQNQALSALLFLYKEVLGRELAWLGGLHRATRPPRLPVVLTHEEVERLLAELQGVRWLIASLLYGAGLRVMECLRLRVKDVDLGYRQILVRDGKGEKDRVTMMPEKLAAPLAAHLARVKSLHARDLEAGFGE
ncbi:MAG TPA: phage integrase N-terminal SAM-like domain-containing protein, partial [Acidobacteriaceae bacterium]